MTSRGRGLFLIAGGVITGLGLVIPGLYGVSFSPPAGSRYAAIDLARLAGFSAAAVGNSQSAVYNGFGGPVSFVATQVADLVMLIVGIVVAVRNVEVSSAQSTVLRAGQAAQFVVHKHIVLKLSAIGAAAITVGNFIWAFRFNETPPAITRLFVADLGGGQNAVAASHYLSGSLGAGTVLLFFGLLIGFAGAFPRIGCSVLLGFVALFIVGLFVH